MKHEFGAHVPGRCCAGRLVRRMTLLAAVIRLIASTSPRATGAAHLVLAGAQRLVRDDEIKGDLRGQPCFPD